MRIRKQASKLLGWAYHSQFPSSSSPPPAQADAGELQCQLNLSPWDAINSPHCTVSQEDLETANDIFQANEKEEQNEELNDRAEEEKCKKTDGKRWHCKRAAKLPHSLCSYHLTQLRSYRSTRLEDQISGDRRKKSSFAADCGGAASNYYYYYSILGPWWGKRRGPVDDCDETLESDNSAEDGNEGGGSSCDVKCNEKKKTKKKKKKKRMIKRRGRKPVKSRSLKSLL